MGYMRTCDRCTNGVGGRQGVEVSKKRLVIRRYALHLYVPFTVEEKALLSKGARQGRMEGAGSIDLCDDCWEYIAKPRTKPRRRFQKSTKFVERVLDAQDDSS